MYDERAVSGGDYDLDGPDRDADESTGGPQYTSDYALLLLSLLDDVAARRVQLTVQPAVSKTLMGSRPPTNMGAVVVHDALKRAIWRHDQSGINHWAAIAERLVEGRLDPQQRRFGICLTPGCEGEMSVSDTVPGLAICPNCAHLEPIAKARARALAAQPDRLVTLEEAAVVLHSIGQQVTVDQLRWRARRGRLQAAEAKGNGRRRYWLSHITKLDVEEAA